MEEKANTDTLAVATVALEAQPPDSRLSSRTGELEEEISILTAEIAASEGDGSRVTPEAASRARADLKTALKSCKERKKACERAVNDLFGHQDPHAREVTMCEIGIEGDGSTA